MADSKELRAQLEVVEFEEELVAAKKNKKVPEKDLRKLKHQLRDARRKARESRDGGNGR